jgi:hypothetical protein
MRVRQMDSEKFYFPLQCLDLAILYRVEYNIFWIKTL